MGLIPARAGKTRGLAGLRRMVPAHPRACGENLCSHKRRARIVGSSPRVRGKPSRRENEFHRKGLIPARAGKTSSLRSLIRVLRAHPRACGENPCLAQHCGRREGSSPRVRGKRLCKACVEVARGLIPARAGETCAYQSHRHRFRAHPRACGENALLQQGLCVFYGSSPRVRGKRTPVWAWGPGRRLIPARAGKTQSPLPLIHLCLAHPRACGENRNTSIRVVRTHGSSPRVRGKPTRFRQSIPVIRLIPARAGKTTWWPGSTSCRAAHPRACGENAKSTANTLAGLGSSPRVRGKRGHDITVPHDGRLIPARAGKTRVPPIRPRPERAHPRACGENHNTNRIR